MLFRPSVVLSAVAILATAACGHEKSGPKQTDANAWSHNAPMQAPQTPHIRNAMGSIAVEPSPDANMHVQAAVSWSRGDWHNDVKFEQVSNGSNVTVCAVWNDGKCDSNNYNVNMKKGSDHSDASVALTVQVPAGVKVNAWQLEGPITIRASAPVVATTLDGNVKIGTAVGPASGETINGDVDVRMTTMGSDTGAVKAETKNGTATAYVPAITDGRVELSTLNGDAGTDFATETTKKTIGHDIAATIGAGSRGYTVKSLNGSVWLRLINADGTVGAPSAASPEKAGLEPKSAGKRGKAQGIAR